MSRIERVNVSCAVAIVAVLLILLGHWIGASTQPASAATPAPPAAANYADAEEVADDIATDSESEPSGILNMTVGELMRDAWLSYETQLGEPQPTIDGEWTTTAEYAASYEGAAPKLGAEFITLPSSEHHGLTHAFRMVASQRV